MSILSNVIKHTIRAFGRRDGMMRSQTEDLRCIAARFPALAELPDAAAESSGVLADPYRDYVTSVSTAAWAVSLQTAALLRGLCVLLKPEAVLDLGSGFSSFVLRLYSRDAPHSCTVHSVDDDSTWLAQTRNFLMARGLHTEGLFPWNTFRQDAASRYQLILHDLGGMDLRLEALPRVLALAAPGGLVVLDDMHKPHYAPHAIECCHSAGFEIRSLRALTLDQFGRHACLAFHSRRG